MKQVFAADKIFTGDGWLSNYAVIMENGAIERIVPKDEAPAVPRFYEDCFIAPAFIDVQVYGAAGKLLAVEPTVDTLQTMQREFAKTGTALFQPTLATNTVGVFIQGIDAVRKYKQNGGKGVLGLHLEGPWLNDEKRGAHVKELIHPPTAKEVQELLEYGKGVITMITLAPEVCSSEILELISSYQIIISAGHSNATYEDAYNAMDAGVHAVTHLFNAMSGLHHRSPGLVGATMNHPEVVASIIPDGYHVDFAAIEIAKKIMGERLFAITDAVAETNAGYYRHQLIGDKYECNGTLSGSALSMHKAFVNLVKKANIPLDEALRMCSLYPAKLLRCDNKYGRIASGASAEIVVLDTNLNIVDVISGSMH